MCVYECGRCLYIFLALPTQVLCARQSPCQYCGLYHLSGLAWGQRQSPVWLRMDFVVDQWDLGGQTVCHYILPCTLPNFCLFVQTLYRYLLDSYALRLSCTSVAVRNAILYNAWWDKLQDLKDTQEKSLRLDRGLFQRRLLLQSHMTPPICTLVHPSIGFCRTWCVTGGANDAAVSFHLNPVNRPYGAIVELHQREPKMVERQMASPEQYHVHTIDHKIAAQRRSQSTLTVPGGWLQ